MNAIAHNDEAISHDPAAFASALQTFRDALTSINGVKYEDAHSAMCEAAADITLAPEVFGALLMQYLPNVDERMSQKSKVFWMEVSKVIGPDWIGEVRRVADFMDKVDEF